MGRGALIAVEGNRSATEKLVEHIERMYRENAVLGPDLAMRGHRLGSLYLPAVRMERANLRGSMLSGSSLVDARLEGVDFTAAQLSDVDLSGARLSDCILRSAELRGARLDGAVLDGCDLRDATLVDASLREARLFATLLSEANMQGAQLSRAHLKDCVLLNTDLRGSLLEEVLASDCVTSGTRLRGARRFHQTRAFIAEVLLQEAEGDLDRLSHVIAIRERPDLCWDAWQRIAEDDPFGKAWAEQVFRRYPESGLLESLEEGQPSTPKPPDGPHA
jgi:hypothetical protein